MYVSAMWLQPQQSWEIWLFLSLYFPVQNQPYGIFCRGVCLSFEICMLAWFKEDMSSPHTCAWDNNKLLTLCGTWFWLKMRKAGGFMLTEWKIQTLVTFLICNQLLCFSLKYLWGCLQILETKLFLDIVSEL